MGTHQSCRECGNDLATAAEEEQEVCGGCQEDMAKFCPMCDTPLIEVDTESAYCPQCKQKYERR